MDRGRVVPLHGLLREWEATRLERTTQAQIASFLGSSKAYGAAKLAEVGWCKLKPVLQAPGSSA